MGASREVLLFYTANRSTDHFRLRKGLSIHGFLRLGVPPPGCAPGFVPNPGHPALIPDVSAALPLRAPLAGAVVVCGGGGLAVPFQPTTPFSPSRAARALHAGVLVAVSGFASDP